MISRRTFLAAPAAAWAQSSRPASRLNILFLIADDLNTDIGCYGAPVKTPHIDALARRGVRFDRAYCQYPLCNPSRSSFLSGLRPETTGLYDQKTVLRQRDSKVEFLPDFFRRHGYFVAGSGKIFHHGKPNAAGFDEWLPAESQAAGEDSARDRRYANPEGDRTPDWAPLDDPEEKTADALGTRAIVQWLERRAADRKPFLLISGLRKPHLPWAVPRRYFDLYPNVEVAPDPAMHGIPKAALITELGASKPPASRAQAIAAYRAATSYMDAQAGAALAALDRLKLRDSTVVVLIGDNGFHLGEHLLWSKHTLFERATRVPMILAGPGIAAGVSPRTTELLDLYPTLAQLAGLSAPSHVQGASLLPLLRRPDAPWDRAARSTATRDGYSGRTVRTERWRYVEWNQGKDGVELYDHRDDPGEHRNLAADPARRETIQKLKTLL